VHNFSHIFCVFWTQHIIDYTFRLKDVNTTYINNKQTLWSDQQLVAIKNLLLLLWRFGRVQLIVWFLEQTQLLGTVYIFSTGLRWGFWKGHLKTYPSPIPQQNNLVVFTAPVPTFQLSSWWFEVVRRVNYFISFVQSTISSEKKTSPQHNATTLPSWYSSSSGWLLCLYFPRQASCHHGENNNIFYLFDHKSLHQWAFFSHWVSFGPDGSFWNGDLISVHKLPPNSAWLTKISLEACCLCVSS